jgi:molybdenum cofactor synthesis domain-containing protein
MRPFHDTIPLDEARRIIDETIKPVDRIERVALADASGRVLARDVVATADVPPFSRAAMDGYAVRAEDTAGASRPTPRVLMCIEQVFTGQMPALAVGPGQCTEIATGAPMPSGADAVVMVEETDKDPSGAIKMLMPVTPGQNIGRRGADIEAGQTVLRAGDVLNASRVGALAALGIVSIEAYARPRVAILSTGNEIVEPGEPLTPGHIYDVNRFTLAAIVADHGSIPVPHRTSADTLEDLSRAVDQCLDQDVLVFSGGSSVGERDLVRDVLAQRGKTLFHGIAVKPGKPTAFGLIDGKPFFGMPGYPTSCLSNGYLLLAPALRRLARLPARQVQSMKMPLAQRIVSPTGRHQIYTVRIADGSAYPAFKASGDITSMSRADGYIEIPIDTDIVEKGELVDVTLF